MKNCSKCGAEWRLVKAGVSKKTGKPYKAFYACDSCNNKMPAESLTEKPQKDLRYDQIMTKLDAIENGIGDILAELVKPKDNL